jgi:Tetraspanin family
LVIVILGFSIIYAGSIAKSYYDVPLLSTVEPEILPKTLFYTGIGMIVLAFLGFQASKTENERLLQFYVLINVVLLIIFGSFTSMLNYSSTVLQSTFEE